MTGRRWIPWLAMAAVCVVGCEDPISPPPPVSGGSGGTGNVGGVTPTGGSGGGATGGAGGMGGSAGAAGSGGMSGAGGSGGMSGAGGGAGGSAGGAGGGVPMGACDNTTDNDAITALNPTSARQVAAQCGVDCDGEPTNGAFLGCVNPCIESGIPGASTICSSCYGDFALCIRSTCLTACAVNACVPMCEACDGYADCLTDLVTCSGRPSRDCFEDV